MKLIIDIPEEVVTKIQNGENYRYDLHTTIAQGIPYEPKGDLISRSALKDKLTDTINPNDIAKNEWYEGYAACVQVLSDLIDNAPTVEPCYQTTSCLDCKNYDKETHNCPRYCEVIKEAIKSRPQGDMLPVGTTFNIKPEDIKWNSGDLISRSELKKALTSNCKPELCHDYNTAWCDHCCRTHDFEDLIDNAPTISTSLNLENITEEDIKKFKIIWQRATSKSLTKFIEDRPKGNWMFDEKGNFYCDQCMKYPHDQYALTDFCPSCGSKMKNETF